MLNEGKMKATLILLLLFVTSFHCKANEIDGLRTFDDVKSFMKKRLRPMKYIDDFFSESKAGPVTQLSKNKFIKRDLNSDGLTDLILNGRYLIVVLDDGHGGYLVRSIDRGEQTFALIGLDTLGSQPKVIVERCDKFSQQKPAPTNCDTLVFKFNDFIEYSNKIDTTLIDEISLSTRRCMGTCPVFEMTIASGGHATYNAILYNKQKGIYECEIDSTRLNDLFRLTAYLNPRSLKSRYEVGWTDDQTVKLVIIYHNGFVKEINDYGLLGTFGLKRLYNIFFALRDSQEWEYVN